MKTLVLFVLVAVLAAPLPLFYEDFADTSNWSLRQGTGTINGATFAGENAWFTTPVSEPFNIYDVYYEIIVAFVNGTWGIGFINNVGQLIALYDNMDFSGTFSGQMLTDAVVEDVVLQVDGEATMTSIRFFAEDTGYGADWLQGFNEGINVFMQSAPWIQPVGLMLFVVAVAAILIFGKRR